MNAAELLVRCLENEGVRYVFGIPGEETLALNEALDRSEKTRFVLTRHEQGAAFMADVYGRLSSYPGVCLAALGLRRTAYPRADESVIQRAADVSDAARQPVILVGNGVIRGQATGRPAVEALRRLVQRTRIWATHTYMAKGALVPNGQHSLPPVGLQRPGAELANVKELAEADVVIAIGYDLVAWAPVLWNPRRDKIVVHVDTTAAELDGHYHPSVEVVGELHESLAQLAERGKPREDRRWGAAAAGVRRMGHPLP